MDRGALLGILLTLLLTGMLTLAFDVQPVEAGETVYIRLDGSVDPSTTPIHRDGDVYTFTGNINDSIVVERDNIVVDGSGYTLHGTGTGPGIDLSDRNNVTIKNVDIREFYWGILLFFSSNNNISGNTIANHFYGIDFDNSSSNNVARNKITANYYAAVELASSSINSISGNYIANNGYGIYLHLSSCNSISGNNLANNYWGIRLWLCSDNTLSGNNLANNAYGFLLRQSSNNKFYHNNFIDNTQQVYSEESVNTWDESYPSGGNYWSDYTDADLYCGPGQDKCGSDGIWDHEYVIDANNRDNYPLVKPYVPGNLTVSIYTDKYTYHAGDSMHLGLNVTNPDSAKYLCFAIWVELPHSSIHLYMHKHSVVLPIGTVYSNPDFESIILPSLPAGTYTWHAAFLERATHTIMVEDTAEWAFIPMSTT